ncbi:MAG TPA: hypothetical protein VGH87_27270, partial [Polyangiaceae bacterium]
MLVVFAIAGCADILGIEPVPEALTGDAAAADAIVDAIVVPDGPFDCNQVAGFECVASAPSGWTLVAFAAASGGTIPAGCSGAYAKDVAQGHAGLTVPPAQCGCTCPLAQAQNTTCPPLSVGGYSQNACNTGTLDQTLSASSVCADFGNPQGSLFATEGAPTSQGSCGTATPSKTLPALQWGNSFAACGYTASDADGGACEAGSRCVQAPSSAFTSQTCIEQTGDVACPGAPYTKKTVVMTGTSDTRDCSACACNASGGSCSATMSGYFQTACGGSPMSLNVGTCTAAGIGVVSVNATIQTNAATCSS